MPELGRLPLSLRSKSRWTTLAGVPALVVHPEGDLRDRAARRRAPALLWMHGRTASKELDPGRFLRLVRLGIGVVSLDLPGHGERADARLAEAASTLEVVEGMVTEVDPVVEAMIDDGPFEKDSLAIGGFSAGGMAALVRLCRPHPFRAALVEATTGNWTFQRHRAMHDPVRVAAMNPIDHLESWRPIPLMILHAEHDEWVAIEGQRSFVRALFEHGVPPELVEMHAFDRTGAPGEHIGFGRFSAQAKDLGAAFLARTIGKT